MNISMKGEPVEDIAGDKSRRGGTPHGGAVRRTSGLSPAATMSIDALFDAVEGEWQEQALCAQTDPEAFFPEKGGSTKDAKRICKACAVRDECLEYALEHDERFGIWGGLSERERRRWKRNLAS